MLKKLTCKEANIAHAVHQPVFVKMKDSRQVYTALHFLIGGVDCTDDNCSGSIPLPYGLVSFYTIDLDWIKKEIVSNIIEK